MLSPTKYRALIVFSITGLLLVAVASWGRFLYWSDQRHRAAVEAGAAALDLTSVAVADRLEAMLREVDFVLDHLRSEYDGTPAPIVSAARGLPRLFPPESGVAVWVADAAGTVQWDSGGAGNPDIRPVLAEVRDGGALAIAPPVAGAATVDFARRLERDGAFAGTVGLRLSRAYLLSRFASVRRPDGSMIGVVDDHGGVFVANDNGAAGFAACLPVPSAIGRGEAGHLTTPDGKFATWHRVGPFPLVAYAEAPPEALTDRADAVIAEQRNENLVATLIIGPLVLLVGLLLLHDFRQRERLDESERRYRRLIDSLPQGLIVVDADGGIGFWNRRATNLLEVDDAGLRQRTVKLFDPAGNPVPLTRYPSMQALRRTDGDDLFYVKLASGDRRWLNFITLRLPESTDDGDGVSLISFTDVSRLIQLEESLTISQSVFEAASEGIMVTDANRRIVRVNRAFTTVTGYEVDEAVGRTPGELLSSGQHDRAFYDMMNASLDQKGSWEGEITNRRKDGAIFVEWLKISAVTDARGEVTRYVALLSDITARKRQDREMWQRANFDALTGLPNRALLMDRLGQALPQAERHHDRVAVLFIDLDKFKPVNDDFGHRAGDDLLCQVAKRITDCVRAEDTVARLGGDEFVVLVPLAGTDSSLLDLGERIRAALALPYDVFGNEVHISASIGIADGGLGTIDPLQILRSADAAMYKAKSSGANRVELFG
ncbi:diguanylate cyclase domain-containing protein [Zavarzinia sp.]|uniref:diguanylate cyclase domain-containing protein n=1 Tax=Zavarzinia sp. TaxID=2027920 RepID=UPI003564A4A7